MSNFGRDLLWDAATWAELDQVATEEAKLVRVAQAIFNTEDLGSGSRPAPFWVSRAEIDRTTAVLGIPEDPGQPFCEISVSFRLTSAQVDAEDTLHTARTLVRAAAREIAMAEDYIIFQGTQPLLDAAAGSPPAAPTPPPPAAAAVRPLPTLLGLAAADGAKGVQNLGGTTTQKLLDGVNAAVTGLARAGWGSPYALVLGADLYLRASSRLQRNTEETPADRLKHTLQQFVLSSALAAGSGILVSLAGGAVSIYTQGDPRVDFVGEDVGDNGSYHFRVLERMQFVVTEPRCITVIS